MHQPGLAVEGQQLGGSLLLEMGLEVVQGVDEHRRPHRLDGDAGTARARAYDVVMDGVELGGGSGNCSTGMPATPLGTGERR